ncbi:MAG TPA: Rieske (2Fe-2S) protein [Nocardioidaceae bacterium]|nr:Rieske (2Fe-2S) protein [Nocardioidaceae bacterium]
MPSRRVVLGAVAAAPLAAACGAEEDPPSRGALGETPTPTPTESPSGAPSKRPKPPAVVLAQTDDVPVGGALFIDSAEVPGEAVTNGVVVTQPSAGDFRAFSRDCTHNHCAVADLQDGKIHCPCHDSLYDLATGENVGGPAPAPLSKVAIRVKGDQIIRS